MGTTLVLLLCSQLPMVTGGDVFLAAMYGHHIKGALLDVDEPFATLVVAMSVCSLLPVIMCWVMVSLSRKRLCIGLVLYTDEPPAKSCTARTTATDFCTAWVAIRRKSAFCVGAKPAASPARPA